MFVVFVCLLLSIFISLFVVLYFLCQDLSLFLSYCFSWMGLFHFPLSLFISLFIFLSIPLTLFSLLRMKSSGMKYLTCSLFFIFFLLNSLFFFYYYYSWTNLKDPLDNLLKSLLTLPFPIFIHIILLYPSFIPKSLIHSFFLSNP